MGGEGSMKNWQSQKLAQKDGIHYTRGGYKLQAKLMFEALMNSYNAKH